MAASITRPSIIESIPLPRFIVWDITYACPLRCEHCYSESGRRRSKQLDIEDMLKVTDAMLEVQPQGIVLSGGEPLALKEIFQVARRIREAGTDVILYTSGSAFEAGMLEDLMQWCSRITVSIDGATAATHDRIRGRAGAFDKAINMLNVLDARCAQERSMPCPKLSIDYVVMQSNFDQLHTFCREIVSRFSGLSYVSFSAVIPTGLASRISFAEQELLDDKQMALLASGQLEEELQPLVDPSVTIFTGDNKMFQLHPGLIEKGMDIPPIQVEPDGNARAMPIYEGVVGSLLEEPMSVLWQRAIERWSHPVVVEALLPATTSLLWAEATRKIDMFFGTPADKERIAARPSYIRK